MRRYRIQCASRSLRSEILREAVELSRRRFRFGLHALSLPDDAVHDVVMEIQNHQRDDRKGKR